MAQQQKQEENSHTVISQEEFNKKVEIEFSHLEYFEYMSKPEAWKKALSLISSQYAVKQRT